MKKVEGKFQASLDDIYFIAAKGKKYHSLRVEFFDVMHLVYMGIAMIASSGPLIAVIADKEWLNIVALLTILVGTVDIVSAFIKKREHASLSRRWEDLIIKIENKEVLKTEITQMECEAFAKEADAIILDSPDIYLGLDAVAYNAATRLSRHHNVRDLDIPITVRIMRHIRKFPKLDLKPRTNKKDS